jgi:uncharacterized protein (TIGR02145 family)
MKSVMKSKMYLAVVALLCGMLSLSACGGGSDDPVPAASTSTYSTANIEGLWKITWDGNQQDTSNVIFDADGNITWSDDADITAGTFSIASDGTVSGSITMPLSTMDNAGLMTNTSTISSGTYTVNPGNITGVWTASKATTNYSTSDLAGTWDADDGIEQWTFTIDENGTITNSDDSEFVSGSFTIDSSGNVDGTSNWSGFTITMAGTMASDKNTISGTWSESPGSLSGNFTMTRETAKVSGYWALYPTVDGTEMGPEHIDLTVNGNDISGNFICSGSESIAGTINGNDITLEWQYVEGGSTYTNTATGTVSQDAMSGTWSETQGGSGTWRSEKLSANPCTSAPGAVTSSTGLTWMDRNLGASQVATAYDDSAAYGDLYQWGRGTDGHEKRTSSTISTLSSSDTPGHGDFITSSSSYSYDWRSPQNDNLWQGVNGVNNPCPAGFRLPTETEWEAERAIWSSNDLNGAISSDLKLASAGSRGNDGTVWGAGSHCFYWSGTVDGSLAGGLYFGSSHAGTYSLYRAYGFSVRCLED